MKERAYFKQIIVIAIMASLSCLPALCEAEKDYLKSGIKAYNKGDYQEAIGQLGLARANEFNNAKLHYYLANAYVQTGKNSDAVREFRIAFALDPESDVGKFSKQALQYM
ncbi:MAG: tetratricopeptide repeat protein, partial [Candidatus Obscuribacterales bacterium]|nr:tetratricopeptide repeat protein [Candidatus Obscuribacterales bacterium]